MRKVGVVLLVAMWLMVGVGTGYSESIPKDLENSQIYTASGKVIEVDWVKSVISVGTFRGTLAIKVSKDTKITEGTDKVTLSEVEPSDPVIIKYYLDSSGDAQAVSISIENILKFGM